MENNKLTVNWMFPDLLNLYGDRGNIMAIDRLCKFLNIDLTINRIENLDSIVECDIAIFNSGDLDTISMLSKKNNELLKFLEKSNKIITFGSTISLFINNTKRINHTDINGLRLIPGKGVEREIDLLNKKYDFGDDFLLLPNIDTKIDNLTGVYIKPVEYILDNSVNPFSKVIYGRDNSGEKSNSGFEGCIHNKIIWTNLLGPAFTKNPWFALSIIEQSLDRKFEFDNNLKMEWEYEFLSNIETKKFIENKLK